MSKFNQLNLDEYDLKKPYNQITQRTDSREL